MTVLILFLAFVCLLLAGLPVVWAMAGGTIAALLFGDLHLPLAWLAQQTLRGADSSTLASIPLFLLAGELMNRGGLTLRIMRVANIASVACAAVWAWSTLPPPLSMAASRARPPLTRAPWPR